MSLAKQPLQVADAGVGTDGRAYWRLLVPIRYEGHTVPKDFITDFASVPRFFWRIAPPSGKYKKAAVIHDYLYRFTSLPRKECDQIFLKAMKELGVVWWKRWGMYLCVRRFGWLVREPGPINLAEVGL